MADYSPKYVTEKDVRNFFTPPLDYTDVSKAEILDKIEAVEKFVEDVYEIADSSTARIPCLLLIASKIIHSPALAKKYMTLSEEQLGDYRYALAQPISRGTDVQSNPYVISVTWEAMALKILNSKSTSRWTVRVANA